jgi:hypothetical protein
MAACGKPHFAATERCSKAEWAFRLAFPTLTEAIHRRDLRNTPCRSGKRFHVALVAIVRLWGDAPVTPIDCDSPQLSSSAIAPTTRHKSLSVLMGYVRPAQAFDDVALTSMIS